MRHLPLAANYNFSNERFIERSSLISVWPDFCFLVDFLKPVMTFFGRIAQIYGNLLGNFLKWVKSLQIFLVKTALAIVWSNFHSHVWSPWCALHLITHWLCRLSLLCSHSHTLCDEIYFCWEMLVSLYNNVRSKSKNWAATSVTRFGDLLDFGQLFKAFGNN